MHEYETQHIPKHDAVAVSGGTGAVRSRCRLGLSYRCFHVAAGAYVNHFEKQSSQCAAVHSSSNCAGCDPHSSRGNQLPCRRHSLRGHEGVSVQLYRHLYRLDAGIRIVQKLWTPSVSRCSSARKQLDKYDDWTTDASRYQRLFALAIFSPVAPDDFLCYLAGTTTMSWKSFTTIILLGKPFAIVHP